MKVLIVAKTRRGSSACVGAICEDGRSLRLIAHGAGGNDRAGMEYEVGAVWDIDAAPDKHIEPPHVENVVVIAAKLLRSSAKLQDVISRFMPPVVGGPEKLFGGFLQTTSAGKLYIARRTGLPNHSTEFWIPDRPLRRDCAGKRIRYSYPAEAGACSLVFVGFQDTVDEIPAGTLLRVSLAHWWCPPDGPAEELRCYAQLSGWCSDLEPKPAQRPPISALGAASIACASDARLKDVLKQTFGFSEFLPVQESIIRRILNKQDTLAVMPTGGGKSLCYQLPAMLFDGLTVVVSPLVALMQDQVSQLDQVGVPAACLNHMVDLQEYHSRMRAAREGRLKLLYVAPETLFRPEILLLLEQSRAACIAIDEAHCISEWGHDFRPEYRQLAQLRQRFPEAARVALTATATERVRQDIRQQLHIPNEGEFVVSFDRKNLFLAVKKRKKPLRQVLAFLEPRRGQSGIIYCGTRKQADRLCEGLCESGWPALTYHAGMKGDDRRKNQERFFSDEISLMVATVAFGMGINKSNVRFVIHVHLPKDLESYYQEVGRAGRDGLSAECLLLYGRSDPMMNRRFIQQGSPDEEPGREARLDAMMQFVETRVCRRRALLGYFGESFQGDCGQCDTCVPRKGKSQIVIAAQKCSKGTTLPVSSDDHVLFEKLRERRKELAAAARLPAYFIFSDRALIDMTLKKPSNDEEFLQVNGVGAARLAKFGVDFLQVIRQHTEIPTLGKPKTKVEPPIPCAHKGALAHLPMAKAEMMPKPPIWPIASFRTHEIARLFESGLTIADIVTQLDIELTTVMHHLERFYEAGGILNAGRLLAESDLSSDDCLKVLEAFRDLGSDYLAPPYNALNRTVSYKALSVLRLYYRCGQRKKVGEEIE